MPDPVDTDALRRDARVLSPGFPGVEKHLVAAAAEVDRLRAELAISENRAGGYEEVVAALRAMVENAPHSEYCNTEPGGIGDPNICTCWKAEVL